MKRATLFLAALAALSQSACSKSESDSMVVVSVTAPDGMPAAAQLRVVLANAGTTSTKYFPEHPAATPVAFPAIFALAVPSSRSGNLDVLVDALDNASNVLGSGSASVAIVVKGRADVSVVLSMAGSDGDGGVPDASASDSPASGPETPGAGGIGGAGGVSGSGGVSGAGGVIGADAAGAGGQVGSDGAAVTGGTTGSGGTISGDAPGAGGIVGTGGGVTTGGNGGGGTNTVDAPAAGGVIGTGGVVGSGGSPPPAGCGDGVVASPEQCDDGGNVSGDGCSPTCKLELGWKCAGSPSVCSPTTCGDGKIEGAENCDDGNAMPFDGCSADCRIEPDCSGASCVSRCGDGIVFGEACDDGNTSDGDGCSATCTVESGFKCAQPSIDVKMLVPVVYRDFRFHNPTEFEPTVTGSSTASPGMVNVDLDPDGKPVFTGLTGLAIKVTSPTTFASWYRNTAGVNHATAAKLALWNRHDGTYVNRYGADGSPWNVTETAYFCGVVGSEIKGSDGTPQPCTYLYGGAPYPTDCTKETDAGKKMLKCIVSGSTYEGIFIVSSADGTPLFFPVDGDTFTPASELVHAQIPPLYDATATWPYDLDDTGKQRLHNFSFTSEMHYWFKYDAANPAKLDITGDDDVWVFINKKLAVDLGGIHTPVSGSVTLDAATATKLGLTDGNFYEIAIFQAERQSDSSTFRITMAGFNSQPSECTPL